MSLGDLIASVNNAAQSFGNTASGVAENAQVWCNSLLAQAEAGISSQFDGDVVGLNVGGISTMKEAIEEYITSIKTHLDQVAADADTSEAMKGEYAAAVKAYVETAAKVCYNVISQLRYFEDKLTGVEQAYTQKDQAMNSEVTSTSNELASQWQEYQRQS